MNQFKQDILKNIFLKWILDFIKSITEFYKLNVLYKYDLINNYFLAICSSMKTFKD